VCVVDATIWASDFLVLVLFCLTADIGWYFVLFSLRVSFLGRLPSLVTGSLTVGLDPDIFLFILKDVTATLYSIYGAYIVLRHRWLLVRSLGICICPLSDGT
jgi:hypothetical protein